MNAIVVLDDGNTWSTVGGSRICFITDEQLEELGGGLEPSDITPLYEVGLDGWEASNTGD